MSESARVCAYCGGLISPQRGPTAKYCGRDCYLHARRDRIRAQARRRVSSPTTTPAAARALLKDARKAREQARLTRATARALTGRLG